MRTSVTTMSTGRFAAIRYATAESLAVMTQWPAARSVRAYIARSSITSFTNRTDGVSNTRVAMHSVHGVGHEGSVMHRSLSTKLSKPQADVAAGRLSASSPKTPCRPHRCSMISTSVAFKSRLTRCLQDEPSGRGGGPPRLHRHDGVRLGCGTMARRHRDPLSRLDVLQGRHAGLGHLDSNRQVLIGCLG